MAELHQFCPWDGLPYEPETPFCKQCLAPRYAGSKAVKYRPPWKKVLYEKQPYEDNHTDSSFLASLVTNANFVKRDYWTVVRDSTVVTQQICTVAVVAAVSAYTLQKKLTADSLLILDFTLLAVGVIGFALKDSAKFATRTILDCALFVSGVYVLSPLFQTLTRTISSDTVLATTIGLLLVHVFSHDYRYSSSVSTEFTGNVSLNAAIAASVLIASRLASHSEVFALMLFALEFFILFPVLRHHVRRSSPRRHLALTISMVSAAVGLLLPQSLLLTALFLALLFFITFPCPYWLIRIEKYKYEINGPWDEARPIISVD